MILEPGTRFEGKYEIRKVIGSGGMGIVYEAFQSELERLVALKVLTAAAATDEEECRRFEREAKILSRLDHPNIVKFYSYGFCNNYPYIVMERLTGDSLQQMLGDEAGRLDFGFAIAVAQQVGDALRYGHGAGVCHRDIKPSNVIICSTSGDRAAASGDRAAASEMRVKLVDYGLAKLTDVGGQKLTQTGMALGSVQYMSPEQCMGKEVDGRGDIYSLGCILYECFTGEPPFSADSSVGVMFQQVNQPISLCSRWSSLSPSVQHVLERCLAKQPEFRYATIDELEADLSDLSRGQSPHSERLSAKQIGKRQRGVAGLPLKVPALVAICGLSIICGALVLWGAKGPAPVAGGEGEDLHTEGTGQFDASLYTSAKAAYMTGESEHFVKRNDRAIAILTRAEELLKEEPDALTPYQQFELRMKLGECYLEAGKFDLSLKYAQTAMILAKPLPTEHLASSTALAANALYDQGMFEQAIEYGLRAARLYEQVERQSPLLPANRKPWFERCSHSWTFLGDCYGETGDTPKAIEAYTKAVRLGKQQNDPAPLLAAYRKLASMFNRCGNPKQARQVMEQWSALEAAVQNRDPSKCATERAFGFQMLAILKSDNGDLSGATADVDRALQLCLESKTEDGLWWHRHWQAVNFYRRNQIAEGDEAVRASQAAWQRAAAPEKRQQAAAQKFLDAQRQAAVERLARQH